MTEEQLRALLRVKRFEQPPPGYFDQLLRDVHRRQRADLLRRPLWRIAVERVQTFFSEHSMGHVSYAGAMAAVLITGIGIIGLVVPGGPQGSMGRQAVAKASGGSGKPSAAPLLTLQTSAPIQRTELVPSSDFQTAQPRPTLRQPRYVIDARPVSYEPSYNF